MKIETSNTSVISLPCFRPWRIFIKYAVPSGVNSSTKLVAGYEWTIARTRHVLSVLPWSLWPFAQTWWIGVAITSGFFCEMGSDSGTSVNFIPDFLDWLWFYTSWTWIYLRNCNFIKCIQLVCLLFVIWTSCQQKPTMTKCFGIRMYIVIEGLDRRLPTQSQCTVISVKRLSYPSYHNNGTSPCSRPLLSRYNSVDHHRIPIARFRNSMDISVWQDYRLHRRFVCSIFIS